MKVPDNHEMDCLERLAHDQSGVIPPCLGNTLVHLESLGLIEKSPRIWLVSRLIRNTYRLTPAGQRSTSIDSHKGKKSELLFQYRCDGRLRLFVTGYKNSEIFDYETCSGTQDTSHSPAAAAT
jgi:hypothetical protein